MLVRNLDPLAQTIARTDQTVEPGESVDVDEDLALALLAQPAKWGPAGETDTDTSVPGVLAQVGDDKGRARTALDKEQASDKPRSTLVDALNKIIDDGSDQ
jgi:hypothetical protein